MLHVGSSLGQLEGIPLEGVKAYIRGAKSVQEVIDMPYPAEDLSKVCPRSPWWVPNALTTALPRATAHGLLQSILVSYPGVNCRRIPHPSHQCGVLQTLRHAMGRR